MQTQNKCTKKIKTKHTTNWNKKNNNNKHRNSSIQKYIKHTNKFKTKSNTNNKTIILNILCCYAKINRCLWCVYLFVCVVMIIRGVCGIWRFRRRFYIRKVTVKASTTCTSTQMALWPPPGKNWPRITFKDNSGRHIHWGYMMKYIRAEHRHCNLRVCNCHIASPAIFLGKWTRPVFISFQR